MGSPIRLADEEGILRDSYGYDEFGNDLYGNQGKAQPFGYTGYRHDQISGTYFAQAREYLAGEGRFGGENLIKGSIVEPFTLNHYGYCWNNPEKYVDKNGCLPVFPSDEFLVISHIITKKVIDHLLMGYVRAVINYGTERNNTPGETLEEMQALHYSEDLSDYTEEIDAWLNQQIYDLDAIGLFWGVGVRDVEFYNRVKTGGSMDIKQRKPWENAFPSITYPDGENKYFLYHGVVMDRATLGNVTYAYVGRKYFSDFMLYSGGAAVQRKRYDPQSLPYMYFLPYWGDMKEDHEAIALGIKWYEEGFCDE